jgi:cell wall assembly regulator SMI1
MTTTQREFDRLAATFKTFGREMQLQPPASETEIESILEITGVNIDGSLKDLWRISNGSGLTFWFAEADEDDEFTPYLFLSIEQTLEAWRLFAPYDASLYAEWYDDEEWGERDPRIQRHILRHNKWISFAEFNGGSLALQFDGDPTDKGLYGQIINYVHDPDAIFWLAKSLLEFFKSSNDVLEKGIRNNPEFVEQMLFS